MNKHRLYRAEFYITNVCNLNCSNCNRLNNYRFSGHQLWNDYQSIYEEWGKRLDLDCISILGGEPFLNSSVYQWMSGLRKIWPNSEIMILTNGTRLKKSPDLYDILVNENIILTITAHDRERYKQIKKFLADEFLQSPLKIASSNNNIGGIPEWVKDAYNKVKDPSWPECKNVNDFYNLPLWIQKECKELHGIDPETFVENSSGATIIDANGVKINIEYAEDFVTAPLKYAGNDKFQVYKSDPVKSHDVCISKFCHHFIKGKLYKCHHVALLPEFIDQFNVDINAQEYQLLLDYKPAQIEFNDDQLAKFLKELPNPIPQCQLCPEKVERHTFQSGFKKIKIVKKSTEYSVDQ